MFVTICWTVIFIYNVIVAISGGSPTWFDALVPMGYITIIYWMAIIDEKRKQKD